MKIIRTQIRSQKKVAENTLEIQFVRPKDFEFVAGQYIQIALDRLSYPDPKGPSRTFSICSSPFEKDAVTIIFRDTGSGYKKTLSELDVGSEVTLEGPFGHFVLPKSANLKHVFVAGGIGVSPFVSMIKSTLTEGLDSSIDLLYANRNQESAAYLENLKNMSSNSYTFSLDLIFGRLGANDIQKYVKDTLVY